MEKAREREVNPTPHQFIKDLARATAKAEGKLNIRRFIKVWREVRHD